MTNFLMKLFNYIFDVERRQSELLFFTEYNFMLFLSFFFYEKLLLVWNTKNWNNATATLLKVKNETVCNYVMEFCLLNVIANTESRRKDIDKNENCVNVSRWKWKRDGNSDEILTEKTKAHGSLNSMLL